MPGTVRPQGMAMCVLEAICALAVWQATPGGSSVTIRPTAAPNAVAEVLFENTGNDPVRIEHHDTLGPYRIHLILGGGEPDTLRIEPPDGYFAVPDEITIHDGDSYLILVYPLEAVGM